MKKEIVIQSTEGLHAALASKLVHIAAAYHSDVYLDYSDKRVDAKSVLGLMSLAVPPGENVNVIAEGDDAEEAIDEITKVLE
ncbi:MAG: HPr family phosphocarrier protein [Bacillota bacterium]